MSNEEKLNTISDIIANHYDIDCRYTAAELKRILDAIIEVMDKQVTA